MDDVLLAITFKRHFNVAVKRGTTVYNLHRFLSACLSVTVPTSVQNVFVLL